MKKKLPIQVIDKTNNTEGYAVIKYGLQAAKSDWVFYTDGDGQYDLKDLLKLVKVQSKTNADVVNGFKLQRHDSWFRKLAGSGFQRLYSYLVGVPIRDIHCDFRLIRRQKLKNIALKSKGATIISELILKLDTQGATFVEIGVTHHDRVYGRSNYRVIKLIQECGQEIAWCLKYKGSKGV
jgi:glycosyltransferase involved in cell wall biosynthesis